MKYSANEESESRASSGMMWFALGLLGGAAVALLTSPASGSENRQFVRRRAKDIADTVSQEGGAFFNEQRQRVNEVVSRGRDEFQTLGSRVNDAVSHGKTAYREAKDRFKDAASEATEAVNGAADAVSSRQPL